MFPCPDGARGLLKGEGDWKRMRGRGKIRGEKWEQKGGEGGKGKRRGSWGEKRGTRGDNGYGSLNENCLPGTSVFKHLVSS